MRECIFLSWTRGRRGVLDAGGIAGIYAVSAGNILALMGDVDTS